MGCCGGHNEEKKQEKNISTSEHKEHQHKDHVEKPEQAKKEEHHKHDGGHCH